MVRIGYINTNALTNFRQFNVIKQDITDDNFNSIKVNRTGTRSINNGTNRIKANIELDFVTDADFADLREIMLPERQLIFMKHPSATNQIIDFQSITNPSTTHQILTIDSNNTNLGYGGTEISTANYSVISQIGTGAGRHISNSTAGRLYLFYFLRFSLANLDLALQRITLMFNNIWCTENAGATYSGFKIEAYNQVTTTWTELTRINYTIPYTVLETNLKNPYQHFATLRPITGFTKIADYSSDTFIYFRIKNIVARSSSTLSMGFGYPCLLLDGFPVSWTNENSFNWRSNVTFVGRTGQLELSEI